MDAEACKRLPTNVREAGFGVESYLSSGRSSAIAISFRPMSFHPSRTAADGPRAGFGGSFALVSVCAKPGTVARQAVRQSPARNFNRFISLLRAPKNFAGFHFESRCGAACFDGCPVRM